MTTVHALARSDLTLSQGCELRLHSHFTQAINLIDPSGRLLTFHRFGKGCSPMGWLFHSDDFDALPEYLNTGSVFWVEDQSLVSPQLRISARRKLNLSVPQQGSLTYPDLRLYPVATGLVGPLNKACERFDHPLLTHLREEVMLWWEGGKPDWRYLIGLGPGLTPSGDDMLTGALAALYSNVSLLEFSNRSHFLPPLSQLQTLTTLVSCAYLKNAQQGRFSTSLLRLLRHLIAKRDPRLAIENLLAHGHTSGADTLIGLVTVLRWLEEIREKEAYARS